MTQAAREFVVDESPLAIPMPTYHAGNALEQAESSTAMSPGLQRGSHHGMWRRKSFIKLVEESSPSETFPKYSSLDPPRENIQEVEETYHDQAGERDPESRLDFEHVHAYPTGTPRLAAFINSSDHNAVFRRFGRLSARLLVQLEIELTDLESKLDNLDKEDAKDVRKEKRLRGFEKFKEDDGAQTELRNEIQKKLCQYLEMLLLESQARGLERAHFRHHLGLFNYMRNRKPLAFGKDDFILHVEDFVSVAKQSEKGTCIPDMVEALVTRYPRVGRGFLKRFMQTNKEKVRVGDNSVEQYSEKRFGIFDRVVVVILAVSILLIPIMLLVLVNMSNQAMSWIVFVFILAFCLIVAVLAEVKTQEIFISTAAYAAVLVTFLGNLRHS